MDLAKACPCCGREDLLDRPAVMAPFIASYVFGREPWPTSLLECRACGFRFFEGRFSPDEEARLYAGYRGERYFRERHRFEWWYSRRANDGLGQDPGEIAFRKRRMAAALAAVPGTQAIRSVLDYGGDRGQFIPDGLGERRYVLDLSGTEPVEGVAALRSAGDLGGGSVDLVLCCNLLEHSPQPAALLAAAKGLLGPGGWLYVEVPLERYGLGFVPRGGWYRRYAAALARHPACLAWVDLYSTAFRLKAGLVPPLGILKAHEHLNFFHPPSLAKLLEASGFAVAHCGPSPNQGVGKAFPTALLAVAKKL
jgi:SAM-dependent methyltransferase